MPQLPPVPAWDSLHPLIIHFPIGLLLVAPVFILVGAIVGAERGRSYLWAALILMVLGTASVFVAVETGEAAGKLAERTPEINAVLQHHEQLAGRTRLTFSVLTIAFALALLAAQAVPRLRSRAFLSAVSVIVLAGYVFGALVLTDTAHNGGRLVHEFGVKALVASPGQPLPGGAKTAED